MGGFMVRGFMTEGLYVEDWPDRQRGFMAKEDARVVDGGDRAHARADETRELGDRPARNRAACARSSQCQKCARVCTTVTLLLYYLECYDVVMLRVESCAKTCSTFDFNCDDIVLKQLPVKT